MRTELVFAATKTTSNPFALCHQVFLGTRKLHKASSLITDSINDAFAFFAAVPTERAEVPPKAKVRGARAAGGAPARPKVAA